MPNLEQLETIVADLELSLMIAVMVNLPTPQLENEAHQKMSELREAIVVHGPWLGIATCGDNVANTIAAMVRDILDHIVSQVKDKIYLINYGIPMPGAEDHFHYQIFVGEVNQMGVGQGNQMGVGQGNQMGVGQGNQMGVGQGNQMGVGYGDHMGGGDAVNLNAIGPNVLVGVAPLPQGIEVPFVMNNVEDFQPNSPPEHVHEESTDDDEEYTDDEEGEEW